MRRKKGVNISDMTNISQNAGLITKGTTVIGEQHNYTGLSPTEVTQIAFAMFREYFPQLRKEALEEVHKIVERELKKIPVDDIQVPTAKIVVPLLQNASITEETNLKEMYGKLLAGDMNKQTKPLVHPAYVTIINQMNSNDAEIFRRIVEIDNSIPVARVVFLFEKSYLTTAMPHFFSPYFNGMDYWEVSLSIENLSRLNIISLFEGVVDSYNYEIIKQEPFVTERFELAKQVNPTRELSIKLTNYVIQMNDFGRRLSKLCF
ncbi:MAG: DUF4393 domain-containing protein [Oscillospiraceae bacterium]|nr:DUF4393 domain-containing protein [Oscillospiraceae bacterium]